MRLSTTTTTMTIIDLQLKHAISYRMKHLFRILYVDSLNNKTPAAVNDKQNIATFNSPNNLLLERINF